MKMSSDTLRARANGAANERVWPAVGEMCSGGVGLHGAGAPEEPGDAQHREAHRDGVVLGQ